MDTISSPALPRLQEAVARVRRDMDQAYFENLAASMAQRVQDVKDSGDVTNYYRKYMNALAVAFFILLYGNYKSCKIFYYEKLGCVCVYLYIYLFLFINTCVYI